MLARQRLLLTRKTMLKWVQMSIVPTLLYMVSAKIFFMLHPNAEVSYV